MHLRFYLYCLAREYPRCKIYPFSGYSFLSILRHCSMMNEAKDTRTISRLYDVKGSDKIIGKRKIEDGLPDWNLFYGKFAWDWMFWS